MQLMETEYAQLGKELELSNRRVRDLQESLASVNCSGSSSTNNEPSTGTSSSVQDSSDSEADDET